MDSVELSCIVSAMSNSAVSADNGFDALDSLEFLDLLNEIEARTGVRIPASDLGQCRTIAAMADYVKARQC